jgi:hypothetical protein
MMIGGRVKKKHLPKKKVAASGVGGAAAVVVLFALSSVGVDLPPEVSNSVAVLVAFAAGYMKAE